MKRRAVPECRSDATATSSLALAVRPADTQIRELIVVIRGQRVLLDSDLARLYDVETKRLNEAVRRNRTRFPADFMFQLTLAEVDNLRSQIATSRSAHGGRRYEPYVFTEQGVAMLSSVLNSERAIAVNILIMRAFVEMRRAHDQYRELRELFERLSTVVEGHDELLTHILGALEALNESGPGHSRQIGFRPQ